MYAAKKLSQQKLLKSIQASFGINRDQLAEKMSCTRRQLDSWLLPETSKQKRNMGAAMRKAAESLFAEAESRMGDIVSGARVVSDGLMEFFESPVSGNKFPKPFRVVYPAFEYIGEKPEDECEYNEANYKAADGYSNFYTMQPNRIEKEDRFGRAVKVQPLNGMSDPKDWGYIKIIAVRNEAEMDGVASAMSLMPESISDQMELCELETSEGSFVVLIYRPGVHPCFDGMILYTGKAALDGLLGPIDDWETVCVKPDGGFEDDFFVRALVKLARPENPDYVDMATAIAAAERENTKRGQQELLDLIKSNTAMKKHLLSI